MIDHDQASYRHRSWACAWSACDIYMSGQVPHRIWDDQNKVKKNVKLKFHMFTRQSKQVSHSFSHHIVYTMHDVNFLFHIALSRVSHSYSHHIIKPSSTIMHDVNFLFHIVFSDHPWCEKEAPNSLGFHMVISHCFSHMPMWKSRWNFHMSFTWSSHAFHMVYSSSEVSLDF